MTRSQKKPPFIDEGLLRAWKRDQKLAKEIQAKGKKFVSPGIKTWARETIITEEMIGCRFRVHNGKIWIPVVILKEMVGHRLGEFSLTRKPGVHGKAGTR